MATGGNDLKVVRRTEHVFGIDGDLPAAVSYSTSRCSPSSRTSITSRAAAVDLRGHDVA